MLKDYTGWIGKKINRLTVLQENINGLGAKKERAFNCRCDCGKEKTIRISAVLNGHTKSCGCLHVDSALAARHLWALPFGESAINTFYCQYQNGAKKRSLFFDLSREDFSKLIKERCFYCNVEPYRKKLVNHIGKSYVICNGLDRINSDFGYTIKNVVPCCPKCNFMKGCLSTNEFLEQIRNIFNYNFNGSAKNNLDTHRLRSC